MVLKKHKLREINTRSTVTVRS